MAQRSTIALNMALFALLLSFTLHFQAQGEGPVASAWGPTAGGQGDPAEFVLLSSIRAVNATDSDDDIQLAEKSCKECHCCLKNTNPQVCLTTCCYQSFCSESFCSFAEVVSCGCNNCVPLPPPPDHTHRRPSPRTN